MTDKLSLGRQQLSQWSNGHDSVSSGEDSFVVLNCSPPNSPCRPSQFSDPDESIPRSLRIRPSDPLNSTPHMLVPERSASAELHNSSFVTGSFSSNVSVEEIQKKLNEVLQENVSLKETLYQNNLAMKQQLTTLGTWQAEMAKRHLSHKEKISETRELILKLRAENEELKKALKEMSSRTNKVVPPNISESTLIATNAHLKSQIVELQNQVSLLLLSAKNEQPVSSKKEKELIALTDQLNRQLETAERSRRQLGVDAERLQAQKTRVEREIAGIKADLEAQQRKTTTVETENHNLMQMLDAREKEVGDLIKQVRELGDEVKNMQQVKLQPTTDADLATGPHEQEQTLVDLGDRLGKQAGSITSLQSWLTVADGSVGMSNTQESADFAIIIKLQTEISELRKMLADEQALGEERAKKLCETQAELADVLPRYQKAVQDLEASRLTQSSNDRHNISYHETQLRGFTEKVDCLTAQKINLEQDVTQKSHKIVELEDRIRELEAENEAIPAMKVQLEVYQLDFDAEREARQNMAGEKERVSEDLRVLQRRNQQLLNELQLYQQNHAEQTQQQTSSSVNNGWTTISTPGRNHRRENTPPSPGPFDE